MNMDILLEYAPLFLRGTMTVLMLALTSVIVGVIGGLLLALAKLSENPLLRLPAFAIADFFRGIPEFLVLLVVFFAGPLVLAELTGTYIEVTPFVAGVVALSLAFACFASETFRSAFLAISAGELEAAEVIGLSRWKIFWLVKMPLMWRNALPGLANIWQVLLKETAIVSAVGLSDIMRAAKAAGDVTREPFYFLLVAAGIYLVITLASEALQRRLEARTQRGI